MPDNTMQGGAGVPLLSGSSLLVRHWSPLSGRSLRIMGLCLDEAGVVQPFSRDINTTAGDDAVETPIRVNGSNLLLVGCECVTVNSQPGEVFVAVDLVPGQGSAEKSVLSLLGGYPGEGCTLQWPHRAGDGRFVGDGAKVIIKPSDPAAGADFAYDFDGVGIAVVHSVCLSFVCDATVISRYVVFSVYDGVGDLVMRCVRGTAITASTSNRLLFGRSQGAELSGLDGGRVIEAMPICVPINGSIGVEALNFQAGDQISDVVVSVALKA